MNRKSRIKKRKILQAAQPVSMKQFLEQAAKAAKVPQDMLSVKVELTTYQSGIISYEYSIYASGYREYFTANSPQGALEKLLLRAEMGKHNPVDVVIEMPQVETSQAMQPSFDVEVDFPY